MASLFGHPYAPVYAASKGGVVQLSRSLAMAWAEDNIQVNSILPGWIETDMTAGAARYQAGPGGSGCCSGRQPAAGGSRTTSPGLAVFLAAPASDYVTGTAIPVDGGYSIHMP